MDEQSNVNAFIRVISDKLFPGDGTLSVVVIMALLIFCFSSLFFKKK